MREGAMDSYLGMEIYRTDDGQITIHQTRYVKELLSKFGMSESNSVDIPMSLDYKLSETVYNTNKRIFSQTTHYSNGPSGV